MMARGSVDGVVDAGMFGLSVEVDGVDGVSGWRRFGVASCVARRRRATSKCIVHLIRASTRYVSYRDLRPICQDLKTIYKAANVTDATLALETAEEKWGRSTASSNRGERGRPSGSPSCNSCPELRHASYQHHRGAQPHLEEGLKTRGLPTDEAAAIKNAKATWGPRWTPKSGHTWTPENRP